MPDAIYRLIHKRLTCDVTVSENMSHIIAACEARVPHKDWVKLREIPYDSEMPYLRDRWLSKVLAKEPPLRAAVTGLWFGLFHPFYRHATVTDFYIAGSRSYEADSIGDWASCPDYFPKGRYAHSRILRSVHDLAYRGNLGNAAEESVCLGYVAFVVKELLSEIDRSLIVKPRSSVGVAIGWDSGDAIYIGRLTRRGFQVRDPKDAVRSLKERETRLGELLEEQCD